MKTISKITIGLVAAALLIVGCGGESEKVAPAKEAKVAPTISEESLGLRKTTIYKENDTTGDKTQYSTDYAGTSTKIKRAFQDAPPMIPHDVADYLPITKGNNACTGCHMPEVATSMGATPLPKSHFLDMRPKHKYDGKMFTVAVDSMKNETSVKEIDHLSGSRFNCTLCHAPQSQGALVVGNTFEPAYTRKDGAFKSTWDEVVYDSLDTVGGGVSAVTAEDIANKDSAAGSLDH